MIRSLKPGAYVQATCYLDFMGFEFMAEIEIRVTDFGQGPTGLNGPPELSDPGWGAEYDIEEIILHLDEPNRFGPGFQATGALFELLAEHFDDDAAQAVADYEPPERDWEYDEDYYRGDR